jgi:ferritin-like metal-binding protein YciE
MNIRIENLADLFAEQLKDLYSAEEQAEEAFSSWVEKASSEELKTLLQDHVQHARKHRERIHRISDRLNVDPGGEKCKGTEGILEEANDFLQAAQNKEVRDSGLVAMIQRAEHYDMAGYGTARTYALHLDQSDAAEELQRTLGTAARIRVLKGESGKIEIPFYNADDFERVVDLLLGADRIR